MHKVFAVILSYNRKELLKRGLAAVCSQTRPCDAVIVVDNASSDGTAEMLREMGYPDLKVYSLSRNIGASGGFNVGFRLAYQAGADFIWMMDDDVVPEPDALQKLLEADEQLNIMGLDKSYLISQATTENGQINDPPNLDLRYNEIGYPSWPETLVHGMVPVRLANFVSILIPRKTLSNYGVPISSMFIWGEDTEYTMRITRDKPGYLVATSKVLHLREKSGPISIVTEENRSRIQYHRHFIRNRVFITRKFSNKYRLLVCIYKDIRLVLLLLRKKQFNKVGVVLKGLCESPFFYPEAEFADEPIETTKVSISQLYDSSCDGEKVVARENVCIREVVA
ncbi:glycosyltransferase family 2 protein [Halomonas sp. M20]|uniref:glycosyltransferase family 2 protein n=1 Tax=Halomonas sp. M20 TaxID=2763264 RepID=UPI001D0B935C|nr:glycosyltransferase family 2 protein [Halomonas sp. M20]